MTPEREGAGEVACCCDAVAEEAMLRGAEGEAVYVEGPATAGVVCLFGCWAAAAEAERDDDWWRKAAKKVERKKGRWDDMAVSAAASEQTRFRVGGCWAAFGV